VTVSVVVGELLPDEFVLCFVKVNKFNESQGNKKPMSVQEVAMGFIRVANEAMCRPIRALTQVLKSSIFCILVFV
jgi:N-methylhydantoinase A/oxoprolinase/acetone carboxylase beta subunit